MNSVCKYCNKSNGTCSYFMTETDRPCVLDMCPILNPSIVEEKMKKEGYIPPERD